ncbi:hypothetical protein L208DRAFT_1407814 [Tricholoma matsutake]|nr:hypothetical protein L208DRAFT_1407814 [Tricholoma matsutake 945]
MVREVGDIRLAVLGPHLGVSQAGNHSGKGLLLRLSICGMQLVPPASAESTQTQPLDPTVQLLDLLSQILDHRGIKVQK